jgi:LysM repeat protein
MATYKVKKGETLRDVAAKAGISIKDLIALNPEIKSPNIKPGQVITTSKATPVAVTPVTATPPVPVKTATATATATPIAINQDKKIAEATAAGNKAVEDINEILDSEFETAEEEVETPPRTVKSRTPNYNPISGKLDGYTIVYSDGTTDFEAVEIGEEDPNEPGESTTTYEAPDGKIFTDLGLYNAYLDKVKLDEKRERGESAYKLLYEEFDRYGLASLVTDVEEFIKDGLSKAELTLKLRGTDTYKTRFAANAERVKNGLAAISEAEYIGLEDQYQNIMRNYGLPESYYAKSKDKFGTQVGFQKFIANDVSATELEDRVMAGQERVLNSNPEVLAALKSFYPGITNGDILAYTLDPTNALTEIKRKVTSAEIGGAAMQAGLKTNLTRADELAQAGITKQQAQQGFQTVAEVAPRGGQLAAMYGEDPYTQTTAEQEVFGLSGSVDAAKQRRKLVGLERAEFSGQSGMSQGALGRERAGNF